MKNQRKVFILFSIMLLLIVGFSVCIFNGACFFTLNRENRIDNFDEVMPDFQLVADRLLSNYNNSVSGSDTELVFSPGYDSDDKTYYLSNEFIRFEDKAFRTAFTTVYNSFDNDFPLFYVRVSKNQVSFCNSTGTFAVVYSTENTKALYFYAYGSYTKAKHTTNEGSGWYQIFI